MARDPDGTFCNFPMPQSHNLHVQLTWFTNPRMHLFHIPHFSIQNRNVQFCSEWRIVGYATGVFWDLLNRSIRGSHTVSFMSPRSSCVIDDAWIDSLINGWKYKSITNMHRPSVCESQSFLSDFCWKLNSLWPRDAILQHGYKSTLAQVLVCCLTAPSHYLNQCWIVISEIPWHLPEGFTTSEDASQ